MFLFESNRVTSALVRRPGCAVRCVSAEWHGANCEQSKWCILLRPLYFLSPSLSPPQLMTFVRRVLALCYVHTWVWYALQVLLTCIHTYIHTHTHTHARARAHVRRPELGSFFVVCTKCTTPLHIVFRRVFHLRKYWWISMKFDIGCRSNVCFFKSKTKRSSVFCQSRRNCHLCVFKMDGSGIWSYTN